MGAFEADQAGGGWQGAAGSIATSYVSSALAKYGLGTQGTGRMAARGYAAAQAKRDIAGMRQDLLGLKLTNAYASFASGNPGVIGDLWTLPVIDQKVTALTEKAAAVASKLVNVRADSKAAKKLNKKVAAIQAKADRRTAKLAPDADYRLIARYGLASGPPLTGSRDDPNGLLVIRHGWSQ